MRNKTNKLPFFIERLFWSEISWQAAANGEVHIINVSLFFSFGSFIVFGFVLSGTVFLAIKICKFSSKCELGCQKFEIEFQRYNKDPLVVVRVSRMPTFCFRFEMLQ